MIAQRNALDQWSNDPSLDHSDQWSDKSLSRMDLIDHWSVNWFARKECHIDLWKNVPVLIYSKLHALEIMWLPILTVIFQSYKHNVVQYRKRFSLLGIIFAWIQKIMIYISDSARWILLGSLNTTSAHILARLHFFRD